MTSDPFKTLPVVYLKPAELFVSQKPAVVTTILGSCVSLTLFHQRMGRAAICHALLPDCKNKPDCKSCSAEKYKYVSCVIPEMIENVGRHFADAGEIEFKLFGGADIITHPIKKSVNQSVGSQNIKSALKMIQGQGLHLKISDVGGFTGRKIYFNTHTGQVLLKRLK